MKFNSNSAETVSIPQTMDNLPPVSKAPKVETPKVEAPKVTTPKAEAPKAAAPKPKSAPSTAADNRTPGTKGLNSRSGIVSAPAVDTSSQD